MKNIRCIWLALMALLLGACAPVSPGVPEAQAVPVFWPAPPDVARVQYLHSFSRADDLGLAKGLFSRLRDFITGAAEDRLLRPMAVLEEKGVIYVADPGAKSVHRFDTGKGDYDLIQAADEQPLPSVVGLALGGNGDVYVADSKLGKVLVIRAGSRQATPLRLAGGVVQPTGLAYDAKADELYVVDTANHVIRVFAGDGSLRRSIGQRGTGDGEFNYPTLLWRSPAGVLYVTDSLNFRVQMLAADGRSLGKFGRMGDGTGDTARHKGVATDSFGHVYVIDALFHAIQIFDQQGRFLLSLGGQGHGPGEFWLPAGMFIGSDDRIYVADSYNRRVQVLRYVGGAT